MRYAELTCPKHMLQSQLKSLLIFSSADTCENIKFFSYLYSFFNKQFQYLPANYVNIDVSLPSYKSCYLFQTKSSMY